MPRRLLAAMLMLAVTAAGAQEVTIPPAVRAAADGIRAEQLARDIEYLASDALLGRNTPSPGFDSAAAYVARER